MNKLRLLFILEYFEKYTDEDHPCTVQDIISMLEGNGIKANRKTIYEDLNDLSEHGCDIIGLGTKYLYLGSRRFELAELRLLVDSVQYSRFITNKKTAELISKLESLCSVHDAKKLHRQVVFRDSIKGINETVYYNIDRITSAIMEDRRITFKYFEYTLSGKQYRKNGSRYKASPFALIVDDENYYLLAYDEKDEMLKHFRVDKMEDIETGPTPRLGREEFEKEDMSRYSSRVFGMFKGTQTDVRMRFSNNMVNAVRDVLGKDLMLIPDGKDHFITHATVQLSPHFYGWVFALGQDAEILGPEEARKEMKELISGAASKYE